jgi:two-component system NtrC family response regulator
MKASVLIVDDDPHLRKALADRFRFWGHETETAADGVVALDRAGRQAFDLILLDLAMPGLDGLEVLDRLRAADCAAEVVVLTAHGSVEKAVEAVKRGADDFLAKPADFALLQRVVERSLDRRRLRRVNEALAGRDAPPVMGPSPAMKELLTLAERAAAADTTVLIAGESGSGKQVLAEHIHARSPRASGPFVYVNCVAISDDLIESTLFGHERGAFTGAVSRKTGRLETAAGGTAFLDEIGDISSSLQAKLLHFLEAGAFERVGGNQTIRVDCRVIAATNRDLERAVADGEFREDLYYRLNVIGLRLPPLRERPEDVSVLARAFLERLGAELKREGLRFARPTLEILQAYAWPGNVRQLRNAVERMAVLAPGLELTPDLLPPEIVAGPQDAVDLESLPYKEAVTEFKRRLLRRALARTGGNQTKTAELIGLQRSYLNRLLKDLGL